MSQDLQSTNLTLPSSSTHSRWQEHEQLIEQVLATHPSISDETRLILTHIGIYYRLRTESSHDEALQLTRYATKLVRLDDDGKPITD